MDFFIAVLSSVPKPPPLPYRRAAARIFGSGYHLEMVLAPSSFMKTLNTTYRGKERSTNVLSFALSPQQGQLFLDPRIIKKEASALGLSFKTHFWNVYLHGILHLKGFRHGPNMEVAVRRLSRIWNL